jgi:hypothetical protein
MPILRDLFTEKLPLSDGSHADVAETPDVAPVDPADSADLVGALLAAHGAGDDEAGSRIAALTPDQLAGILGTETQESLVDKVVTVHGPHGDFQRHQKVSAGDEGGTDARTSPHDHLDPGQADHVLGAVHSAIADSPEVKGKPGLLHRIGDACITAAARINLLLVKATPAIHKILDIAGDILDTPKDMLTKFGYNPTMSSGAGGPGERVLGLGDSAGSAVTNDPLAHATGLSSHFLATVATKVLAAGIVWGKRKLGMKILGESEQDDTLLEAGGVFARMLAVVCEELGLDAPDLDAVAAAFAKTVGGA